MNAHYAEMCRVGNEICRVGNLKADFQQVSLVRFFSFFNFHDIVVKRQ